jgi:hypothetical protein
MNKNKRPIRPQKPDVETLTRGNFSWQDNIPDSKSNLDSYSQGRFLVGWIPPADMQNQWEMRRNEFGHVCTYE